MPFVRENNHMTVAFIFSNNMKYVILETREKEPYKGKLNGVGGKAKYRENAKECVYREILEETGIRPSVLSELNRPVTTILHDAGIYLHVYYAKCDVRDVKLERENVDWYPVEPLFTQPIECFAGDGDVLYFINLAKNIEKMKKEFGG